MFSSPISRLRSMAGVLGAAFPSTCRRSLRTNARLSGINLAQLLAAFTFACAAYNLVRMRNLATAVPAV
jgi:hypothetical protein